MATRFYLIDPETGPAGLRWGPDVADTINSWTIRPPITNGNYPSAYRGGLRTTRHASTLGLYTVVKDRATDIGLAYRLISAPLAAQTITGTVKGQIQAKEDSASADGMVAFAAHVCYQTGSTPWVAQRGVLLSSIPGALASEFTTSPVNRKIPQGGSTAISSLAVTAGDRLVLDIGVKWFEANATTRTFTLYAGDGTATTDLPEDETDTGAKTPWVEFSHNFIFQTTVDDLVPCAPMESQYLASDGSIATMPPEYLHPMVREHGQRLPR